MATCMVCEDEVTKKNPLYVCIGCDIKVHKLCYGTQESLKNWKCSPCLSGKTGFIKCQLCFQKGNGPFKQTECNKWVHVVCALFTDGVVFSDEQAMEPVNLSNVSSSARNKRCAFCYNSQGYCSTCSQKKCKVTFHITCAQKQKLLREEKVDPKGKAVIFKAYCKEHVPNESHSRLSSGSVQVVVDKKRQMALKMRSAIDNADWILGGVQSHSTPNRTRKRNCKWINLIDWFKLYLIMFYSPKPARTLNLHLQNPLKLHQQMKVPPKVYLKAVNFAKLLLHLKQSRMPATKTKLFKRFVCCSISQIKIISYFTFDMIS